LGRRLVCERQEEFTSFWKKKRIFKLPEQGFSKQNPIFVPIPWQEVPPPEGAGSSQVLSWYRTPRPHASEQELQSFQADHPPDAAPKITKKLVI
jgi:hypothetical protein